jgi:SAM-dependent methyltransferase
MDAGFGAALAINLLDHCKSPREVLAELRRVLTNDGVLLLGLDCQSLGNAVYLKVREALSVGDTAHPHSFTLGEATKMLARASFTVLHTVDYHNLGLYIRDIHSHHLTSTGDSLKDRILSLATLIVSHLPGPKTGFRVFVCNKTITHKRVGRSQR